MKNKNTKKLLFKFLKTGIFTSVVFLVAFLIFRTYEIKPTIAASASIDCSVGSPRNIVENVDFNSGDDLTLYGNGTCVWTNTSTVTLNSLVVGSVGGDTTVLTHQDNSTTQAYSIDISVTGDITIHSGASINTDGLGYDGGTGSSVDDAQGPGSGDGDGSGGSGAGHGGNGGNSSSVIGGTAYCDISNVATIGSGGGSGYYSNSDGGNGGGLIILNASGTATINGTITADGTNGAGSSYSGGGGAGGGVKISADTIAGTPTNFSVTGGTAYTSTSGGGGGGCILLEYTTSSSILDASLIDMYGNSGYIHGGAGQLLIKQNATNGDLFVKNNGTEGADTTQTISPLTVDSITLSNEANYVIPSTSTLTVSDASPFGGDGTGLLESSGNLIYTSGNNYDNLTVSILSGGTLSNTATINITNDGGLILNSGSTVNTGITTLTTEGTVGLEYGASFIITTLDIDGGTTTLSSYNTANTLSLTTLDMDGGILTHGDNSDSQANIVNISAASVDIGIGASINTDGLGYDGGRSGHVDGYGPGAGLYSTIYNGSGAGHGGDGGADDSGDPGGTAYCNISNVATIGSGGSSSYSGSRNGGDGGGLIILNASGTATINGTITANGTNSANYAGGGAGGGVKISADTIAGTPNFTVIGGTGIYGGGGGGGGCILLEYTTSSSILDASLIDMYGNSGYIHGGAGQLLIKQNATNGDLFVKNNGTEGADTTQTISPLTVDSITLSNEANYVIPSTSTLTVSDASPFGGDGTGLLKSSGNLIYTSGNNYDNLTVSILSGGTLSNTATINITDDGGLILNSGSTVNTGITTLTTEGILGLDNGAAFSLTDLTITGGTTTLNNYTTLSALSIDDLVMTGGILTHGDNLDAQDHVLNISATSVDIGISASVNADGLGYDGGRSGHVDGYGLGAGINIVGSTGPGGGHGGDGGADSSGDPGGTAYCNISNVATIGSGGAAGYSGSYNGGDGGGLIIFDITNTITINGTITADGTYNANYAGGGAGGGVKISADTIAGAPASFSVAGGAATNGGGGGGGGCVLLEYLTSNSINSGSVTKTGGIATGSGVSGSDGLFNSTQLAPSAPDNLYSHSTDASSGDVNPVNLTTLTPYFSAICHTSSGQCSGAGIEVDNDSDFSSPIWQSGSIAITATNDSTRSVGTEIIYDGSALSYNTTYYWRIRFYNAYGAGAWSTESATFLTPNNAPTVSINSVASKTNGTGSVDVDIELDDNDLADTLSAQIEYKAGVDCSSGTSDPTIDDTLGTYSADSGTPTINNAATYQVSNIPVVDTGSNTVQFDWLSATDVPAANGTYCIRVTPYDGIDIGTSADASFTLDNVNPTASGNLTESSVSNTSITYTLGAAGSDTNLDQYSIYYKAGVAGVTTSDSLHTTIASGAYTPGNTTTINSLSVNTQYVTNIWTYDSYGNEASATELAIYTTANTPGASIVSNPSTSTLDIAFDVNSNPGSTEFAIQETGSGNYLQADGSLGVAAIWQDNATWGTTTATGLSLNTSYTFQTKARNGDGVETPFGGTNSLYTLAEIPGQPVISNLTNDSFDVTLGSDSNPAYTTYALLVSDGTNNYYIQADGSLGASEVWQTKAVWGTTTVAGLTAETSYTVRAKARNEDGVETAFDGTDSGTTEADPDVTIPTISNQSPADGATDVDIDTNIYFKLNDSYTGINIDTLNLLIEGSPAINNGTCEGGYSCTMTSDGIGGYDITVNPNNNFDYSQEVNIFVMVSDGTNSTTSAWSFTTKEGGATGDTTPPSITNLSPEKGAIKISPNTTISFNILDSGSGVDIGTLRTTVVGSKSGVHKNILRAFDGNASNFEVTLIPERDFEVNEQVTLEIRVRDYAQNQTILSEYIFLIEPAQEPTVDSLIEEGATEIWRAQTVKTEEELEVEQSQGIIDDGANIEVGDLTYDGTKEIVTTPRAGAPYVRIYSKEGLILTPPFLAYDKSYTNGVNVAIGDLEGTSGEQEIITSPMDGAAHIRIFNKDGQVLNSFFAREDSFRGNSIVKIANLEGPDRDSGDLEIIILFSDGILKVFNKEGQEIMAPIQAFLPHLQNTENIKDILFDLGAVDIENNGGAKEVIVSDHNTIMIYGKDPKTKKLKQIIPDIIPFESGSIDYNKGIVFSVVDIDGTEGEREIVVGSMTGSSIVKFFNKDGQKIKPDFYAYDPTYYGGIDLEVADLDGTEGPAEIITIAQNYSAHVRIFNKDGQPITSGFMAYPEHTNGKTKIQAANLNNEELQGGEKNKDLIITPIQGPTHARFYSKDSELLTEGFYIVGVGTRIEIGE